MTDLPLLPLPDDNPAELIIAPEAGLIPSGEEPDTHLSAGDPASIVPLSDALPTAPADMPFRCEFAGRLCNSRKELALAMADAWDDARTALLTSSLAEQLDAADLPAAAFCRSLTARVAVGEITPDRAVLEAIHTMSGQPLVVWCGRRYASAQDLGGSLLQALRGTGVIPAHCDSLMRSGAASLFADESQRAPLSALEARYAAPDCSPREQTLLMYMVGFLLSGVAAFVLEEETFYTVEQLAGWLEARAKRSAAAFTRACHRLLDEDYLLDPQLEAWLIALGRRQDVALWQAEIEAGML